MSKVGFYLLKKRSDVKCTVSSCRHTHDFQEYWLFASRIFPLKRHPTLTLDFCIVERLNTQQMAIRNDLLGEVEVGIEVACALARPSRRIKAFGSRQPAMMATLLVNKVDAIVKELKPANPKLTLKVSAKGVVALPATFLSMFSLRRRVQCSNAIGFSNFPLKVTLLVEHFSKPVAHMTLELESLQAVYEAAEGKEVEIMANLEKAKADFKSAQDHMQSTVNHQVNEYLQAGLDQAKNQTFIMEKREVALKAKLKDVEVKLKQENDRAEDLSKDLEAKIEHVYILQRALKLVTELKDAFVVAQKDWFTSGPESSPRFGVQVPPRIMSQSGSRISSLGQGPVSGSRVRSGLKFCPESGGA
uniref:Uncharacterized protein n=1 Tax=Cannabis sativa TaxID=3483 RepID=A0A803PEX0_CANSA